MVSIFIVLSIDVYFLSTWGLRTIGRGVESRKGINNLFYLGHKKSITLTIVSRCPFIFKTSGYSMTLFSADFCCKNLLH